MEPTGMLLYGSMLAAIWATYGARRASVHRRNYEVRAAAERAGLLDPPSRHPSIDPMKCLGCGACVSACPENDVLGVIRGKAQLIDPTACVGHGACFEACPTDAIRLVFGTPTKGVHVPVVGENLESSVPGVFIAGELGGIGLIANAVEQGRRAVEALRDLRAPLRERVRLLELLQPDRRGDVGQVVLEARRHDLVVPARHLCGEPVERVAAHAVQAHHLRALGQRRIARHQHAAPAGGDGLVGVKA